MAHENLLVCNIYQTDVDCSGCQPVAHPFKWKINSLCPIPQE